MPRLVAGNPFGSKIDPTTEIADQVQGELITFGAAGIPTMLAPGAEGEVLTSHGAAADLTWEPASSGGGEGWTFIEKLSPAAAASISSTGTITVYEEYLIVSRLVSSATSPSFRFQVNGDTAANYDCRYLTGTTMTNTAGLNSFLVGTLRATYWSVQRTIIAGASPAVASGLITAIHSAASPNADTIGFSGKWAAGNGVQLTSFTFFPDSGNITGTIEIYGRNAHA